MSAMNGSTRRYARGICGAQGLDMLLARLVRDDRARARGHSASATGTRAFSAIAPRLPPTITSAAAPDARGSALRVAPRQRFLAHRVAHPGDLPCAPENAPGIRPVRSAPKRRMRFARPGLASRFPHQRHAAPLPSTPRGTTQSRRIQHDNVGPRRRMIAKPASTRPAAQTGRAGGAQTFAAHA